MSIFLFLIYSCAAEGRAGGGPVDITGPAVIRTEPQKELLSRDERITIRFDEIVDPLSVPASISIVPDTKHIIHTHKRSVTIIPETGWPRDEFLQIQLSRSIRDYQGNGMREPVSLFYRTGDAEIPAGEISGKLYNMSKNKIYDVGVYLFESGIPSRLLRKKNASENGSFEFFHLEDGEYIVAAVEGELRGFSSDFRHNNYGIQSRSPVTISSGNTISDIQIYIDQSVEQLSVQAIEFTNRVFGDVIFSDGSSVPYFLDLAVGNDDHLEQQPTFSLTRLSGDTLNLSVTLSNRLEIYQSDYRFIVPDLVDTIPPVLQNTSWEDGSFYVTFSEPVKIASQEENADSLFLSKADTVKTGILPYEFLSGYKIRLLKIPEKINRLQIQLYQLTDYFSNTFEDSLKDLNIMVGNPEEYIKETGSIIGTTTYSGQHPLVIEAASIETGNRFYTTGSKSFEFKDIPPGYYVFRAYEKLNRIQPDIYFSGLWDPFESAAAFGLYPDTVEVRKRWVIEGVHIEIPNSNQ